MKAKLRHVTKRASFYIRFIYGKLCKFICKCTVTTDEVSEPSESTPISSKNLEEKNQGARQG